MLPKARCSVGRACFVIAGTWGLAIPSAVVPISKLELGIDMLEVPCPE